MHFYITYLNVQSIETVTEYNVHHKFYLQPLRPKQNLNSKFIESSRTIARTIESRYQ